MPAGPRSHEQLRRHYEIERGLADRLRASRWPERAQLYRELYDELFRSVPELTDEAGASADEDSVARQLGSVRPFLEPASTYLELGAGNCALASRVADLVEKVYAVEVSPETLPDGARRDNLEVVLSDGRDVPVPGTSVDVVLSHQVMEHLHPDDAPVQLAAVREALRPGGVYVCMTPNALSGPHDVSKHFDADPTGFHLKEYTNAELRRLLLSTGFTRVRGFLRAGGRVLTYPLGPVIALERVLAGLGRTGRRLARLAPLRKLLGNRILATR